MNRRKIFAAILVIGGISLLIIILLCPQIVLVEQKTITLPKGSTVEKVGAGHFKFKLPNGRTVEAKEFDPKTSNFGYCRIDDATWKSGKGRFKGQAKQKVVKLSLGTELVTTYNSISI